MKNLALPAFSRREKQIDGKPYIWALLRRKYVRLTPEEWVRQHMIHYLVYHLTYSSSLVCAEVVLPKHQQTGRADIVVYNRQHQLSMIVECKAPTYRFSEEAIMQMMGYNQQQVPYLLFTNGCQHFCFVLRKEQDGYVLLSKIPSFADLNAYSFSYVS